MGRTSSDNQCKDYDLKLCCLKGQFTDNKKTSKAKCLCSEGIELNK